MSWLARAEVEGVVRAALAEGNVAFEQLAETTFLVHLEGRAGLQLPVRLVIGDATLLVEAFFVRRPDDNAADFYRFLLERNAHAGDVHFAIGRGGDVYLLGRMPFLLLTPEELGRVLGAVVDCAEAAFDAARGSGFAPAINRDRRWHEHAPLEDPGALASPDFTATSPGGRHRRRG